MTREEAKDLFRNDKDAYGKPRAIMHKIDQIFDAFEKPLPPAEGAEEMIRERFGADVFENPPYYPTFAVELQQLMETFATLHAQQIADKMVSERWINVKDGLPMKDGKSSIYCLVNSEYDGIVVRPYNEYHKCWDTEDADDYYCDAVGGKITHWMPLPNPPIK